MMLKHSFQNHVIKPYFSHGEFTFMINGSTYACNIFLKIFISKCLIGGDFLTGHGHCRLGRCFYSSVSRFKAA